MLFISETLPESGQKFERPKKPTCMTQKSEMTQKFSARRPISS